MTRPDPSLATKSNSVMTYTGNPAYYTRPADRTGRGGHEQVIHPCPIATLRLSVTSGCDRGASFEPRP